MLHKKNKLKIHWPSSVADRLKEFMEYYNVSVAELATRLGSSKEDLEQILARKAYMDETLAKKIEEIFGISTHLLL